MKSFITRPALLLATMLGLAACGGTATYEIGGAVTNVLYPGLVLANGNDTVSIPANATKYAFPNKVEYGDVYTVTIKSNPAHQSCLFITNGGDQSALTVTNTAGRLAVIDVPVQCGLTPHNVIVTVNEAAEGLVLTNGSRPSSPFGATATSVAFEVAYGNSYGITVLTQPKNGKTCTVANGTGTMGDVDITNVAVTCK